MLPGVDHQQGSRAPEVRPIQAADLAAILALNNAHAREISLIDEGGLVTSIPRTRPPTHSTPRSASPRQAGRTFWRATRRCATSCASPDSTT
jgi:hypothetical protein